MSGIEFLLGDVQEDFNSSRKSLKIQQTAKSAYEKSQYEVGFAAPLLFIVIQKCRQRSI